MFLRLFSEKPLAVFLCSSQQMVGAGAGKRSVGGVLTHHVFLFVARGTSAEMLHLYDYLRLEHTLH